MKLLLWHCQKIKYVDARLSTRPEKVRQLSRSKTSATFNDVLVVLTCVESTDSQTHVDFAVEEIRRNLEMIGHQKHVVIMPFVHLSSNIAQPQTAIDIIHRVTDSLERAGVTVSEGSFGFHKDFELHFKGYGHPGSVCFRSIPYTKGGAESDV